MIQSERLILKRWQVKYAEEFYSLIKLNQAHLGDYFSNLKNLDSIEEVRSFLRKRETDWNSRTLFAYGIFLKPEIKLIGHISIRDIDWNIPKGELAYFVFEEFTGKGYATEALMSFCNYYFENMKFNRLFMKIDPENKASIKTALNSGFEFEGMLKNDYKKAGVKLIDMNIYGCIKNPGSFSQSGNR